MSNQGLGDRRRIIRTPKSQSISALPMYLSLPNTTFLRDMHQTIATTSSATGSPSTNQRRTHSRGGSSVRGGSRSQVCSPSKLPATDSLSYFPPFEAMGGKDDSEEDSKREELSPTTVRVPDIVDRGSQGHKKGRSLSSIAGFMSASLTWGLSSLATTSTSSSTAGPSSSSRPPQSAGIADENASTRASDTQAVEALTKRFPQGKRRVLEPLSALQDNAPTRPRVSIHKRRMKSADEVERLVMWTEGVHLSLDCGGRESADEDAIENLIGGVGHQQRTSTDEQPSTRRNPLSPGVNFPTWRFPLPSPPVTSLSPDIPLELFRNEVDNPICASDSCRSSLYQSRGEEDDIDDSLSPSPTSTSASPTANPARSRIPLPPYTEKPTSFLLPDTTDLKTHPPLQRKSSQWSCDSKETIRPGKMVEDPDTTPKARKEVFAGP